MVLRRNCSERNGFSMEELEKTMDTVTGQFALCTDMDGKIITLGAEPGNTEAEAKSKWKQLNWKI